MDVRPELPQRAQFTPSRQLSTRTALGPAPDDVIVERPEGLARGRVAWPAWAIALVGAGVVLTALVYYLLRLRSGKHRWGRGPNDQHHR